MPKGAKIIGHIHSHGIYDQPSDLEFSRYIKTYENKYYDENLLNDFKELTFYLLNPNGELWVRRADNILIDGFPASDMPTLIAEGLPYDSKEKKLAEHNEKRKYVRPSKFRPTSDFIYK